MDGDKSNVSEWISNLTCDELRVQLIRKGVDCGPIGQSIRPSYERLLLRNLTGDQKEIKCDNNFTEPLPIKCIDKNAKQTYYAINASNMEDYECDSEFIFDNRSDLMKKLKETPNGRFKLFQDYESACDYVKKVESSPSQSNKKDDYSEGANIFRSVKRPELNIFRRFIEKGELEKVCESIRNNPRYLITDVDTPIILQEGSRHNALHACAVSNQFQICEAIMEILDKKDFMSLLYPKDSDDIRDERTRHILDLYLNMPDKQNGESPLHIACKKGHIDVVQVLCTHRAVDRAKLNKYGETPEKIICSSSKSFDRLIKQQIKVILAACYYIPILRSDDHSTSGTVGNPCSPDSSEFLKPKFISKSPKYPQLSVKAYAGPMSPSQVKQFQQQIKPPSPRNKDLSQFYVKRKDCEKGLERICRKVAADMEIPWFEYWDFLNSFVDLSTQHGLEKVEAFLKEKSKKIFEKMELNSEIDNIGSKMKSFYVTSPEKAKDDIPESPVIVNSSSNFILQPSRFSNTNLTFNSNLDMSPNLMHSSPHSYSNVCDNPFSSNFKNRLKSNCSSPSRVGQSSFFNNVNEMDNKPLPVKSFKELFLDKSFETNNDCSDQSDDDSDASFHTADNDSDKEDIDMDYDLMNTTKVFENEGVFLSGSEPSKLDQDVLYAIGSVEISYDRYPCLSLWRNHMMRFSEDERACWRTPMRLKTAYERRIEEEKTPVRPSLHEDLDSPPSPSMEERQTKLISSFLSF